MLQTLFTKSSASAKLLSQQEMCARFLRSMDDNRRAARFLMKQFVVDASNQASRSGDIGRAYEKLKEEITQLKQSTNSQRIQSEQTISDLQNRLQGKTKHPFRQACSYSRREIRRRCEHVHTLSHDLLTNSSLFFSAKFHHQGERESTSRKR